MSAWLLPALYVLLVWWLGTGIVLWLQHRLTPGSRPAAVTLIVLAVLSLVALAISGATLGTAASLAGFTAAIFLWGSLELSHNLGLVTGVHADHCPADARGWHRFRLALGTSIWHELSVLGTGIAVSVLLIEAVNPTGALSFTVLWLMRWSAKLNLFLGVPNFSTEWFPSRLRHLASYVRRAPVSLFYPLALTLATLVLVAMLHRAGDAVGGEWLVYGLPAVLLMLAILEHAFLAIPLPDQELWNRWFRSARARLSTDLSTDNQP